jgi:dTDP-4-amino-4,6-dideoxygalactose transaminase
MMAGTVGHMGTTSFYPSKNLGCYGDGGAMFSRDEAWAHKLRMVANHGMQKRYYHDSIGVNSRLDSMQAVVLNVKLPHLKEYQTKRQEVAAKYDERMKSIHGVTPPARVPWSEHVFHQYTLRVKDGRRDDLQKFLAGHAIPTMIYYPVAMHEQAAYSKLVRRRVTLHATERLCKEVLSLPMHPDLSDDQMDFICEKLAAFFA